MNEPVQVEVVENRRRNLWAVELLDVRATDRALEIGFGPGVAIRELTRRAPQGYI